ncbi:MAG: MSF transporter [Candidatus Tokpelaia sp. JSC189]|nr:MAG: MSF transporter [Candidatus Tokpelaia sp. JSC189]
MANPYYEIFQVPGTLAFSITGLIARYPLAMITLGIVTMISQTRGHYGLASLVATTYAISGAFIAPQISRLADCYGQAKVALPASIISACAMAGLILASYYQIPTWSLFTIAALIGVMPSFGAFVRARWSRLFSGSLKLHSAFAYESIIDEAIFMTGPVIAIYLSTVFFPEAGLGATIILLMIGCILFCLQKKTEPTLLSRRHSDGRSVIFSPCVQILALTLLAIGGIFGTAEVTAIAFAQAQGNVTNSMYPLVAYALGSFIAGIIYGGRSIKMELSRQFGVAITLAALTTLPLLLVSNVWHLTLAFFIAGAAVSPTIIIAMKLVESLVPKEKLTEGITWNSTGLSMGLAIGISLSGLVIDRFGIEKGFYIPIAAGFLALLIILAFRKKLEQEPTTI